MKNLLICSLLVALLSPTAPALAEAAGAAGSWNGAIEIPDGELAIAVTLEAGDDGWSGTIDIPAQGLQGFTLSAVAVEERTVHFEMAGVPGQPTFEGELSSGGDEISGTFRQGPQSLPFALRRSDGESEAPEDPPEPPVPAVPGEGPVGEWLGTLEAGPMSLRLVLRVKASEDGTLTATLDSVDQNAELAVDSLAVEERSWHFTVESIGASFEGTMEADGSAVEGTWSQGLQSLPVVFHRLAEPFVLRRPQNPQPPFPYDSREVTFRNEEADIRLAGTLVVPDGDGPFPTVLFVTGSGAQDRDESLMGHKPFLVIADHLARRGIASLRFDDRGVGASEGDFAAATVADLANDVAAGVAYLATQPELVDPGAIGIVGHSEGGLSAPQVAAGDSKVDFLVLLAPPGEPLDALLMRQTRAVLEQAGVEASLVDRAAAAQAEDLALIRDPSLPTEEVRERLRARAASRRQQLSESERARLGLDPEMIEQGILQGTTPWFRSLVREDPAVHLRQIEIPVLALFGAKDIQVDAEINAERVEAALAAAGNQDFDVRVLPGLNHLFQPAETGAVSEYGTIEETFAPEALEILAGWIEERFVPEAPNAT